MKFFEFSRSSACDEHQIKTPLHHRADPSRHIGSGGGDRDGMGDAGPGRVPRTKRKRRHQDAADESETER